VRPHPLKPANPPIPANAVGAFEGGFHFDCDIFRPSPQCKMDDEKVPFCAVCENVVRAHLGRHFVSGQPLSAHKVGLWTHAIPFDTPFVAATLFYNFVTGDYVLGDNMRIGLAARSDGTPVLDDAFPQRGTGNLNPGWSILASFRLGGVQHLFGHEFGTGRRAMWRLGGVGDTLVQTFFDTSGLTRSHVVSLELGGRPHVIGYDMFSGEAMLSRIDANDAAPVDVAAMSWGTAHTALAAVRVDDQPFVVTYRAITGEVAIRKIVPTGFVMAMASASSFWPTNVTHVASTPRNGNALVTRYSSGTGQTVVHHIGPGGATMKFVAAVAPPPGPGALSLFGVGAQVLGLMRTPTPLTHLDERLFLYRAISQELVEVIL
jgi:hypothetical protein